MLSSRRELQSYDIPPRQLRENPDQLENMGITRLKNNYMKYRIGLSRELLLHSNQTMTLASVLSPPLEFTIEWRSSPRWLGPPWAGVEVLPQPVSSPGREITALQEGAAAMKIDMPMVLIRRGSNLLVQTKQMPKTR